MENCKLCNIKSEYLENHHIIPKSRNGSDSINNIIRICSKCHGLIHDVSFVNERGGLLKDGIIKSKQSNKTDEIWLEKNKHLYMKKMMCLYEKNQDEHMLILLLIEKGAFSNTNIRKWIENGKTVIKTQFTFC